MLVDSLQARSICHRLQRAQKTLSEMIRRGSPPITISLAKMNVTVLLDEFNKLPRRLAA